MLDNLSDRLKGIFGGLKSKGKLSEADINAAMREIRLALLEADVNFTVVKGFIARTKERCLTAEVLDSLTPAQNVIKVVLDELTALLGTENKRLALSQRIPNVIMLVGLQGSGKTTAAAKLAYLLKNQGHSPLLAACDVYRPAAADQLETLGNEIGVRVYRGEGQDPVKIAKEAVRDAIDNLRDVVIVDTAGRLHVDELMMQEARNIRDATQPEQVIMVVDAMTGQDAVNVALAFAEQVDFDGFIMSKMDGDARGGGALSIREMTGKPILFISRGEKPDALEAFHPDRLAKRILGMGDMLTLIEKATNAIAEQEAKQEAARLAKADFTFDDFLEAMGQVKKMGGVNSILDALPSAAKNKAKPEADDGMFDKMAVIIGSMTKAERAKPAIINGQRRARIAKGAGVKVHDVNVLLDQYNQMRKMVRKAQSVMNQQTKKGKKGKKAPKMRMGAGGMGALNGLSPQDLKALEAMLK